MNWQPILEQIHLITGQTVTQVTASRLMGGDISAAYRLQTEQFVYFIKLNRPEQFAMFQAEAAGLQQLAATHTVRVPQPMLCAKTDDYAFLVLEFIELHSLTPLAERLFGEQLASLHQIEHAYFGWHQDNTIGSTAQNNPVSHDWPHFWRDCRLVSQLALAAKNGYRGHLQALGERLCVKLPLLFDGYQPKPSLLHGDLWSGNVAMDLQGNPVLFDPACYYGDRVVDIAMTTLFNRFGNGFYEAYQATYPLDENSSLRTTLYNLYHIFNHLNLFGSGYLKQAERMIESLLADLG